jgi:ribonucleoside-diphosphate reductase alpha chain
VTASLSSAAVATSAALQLAPEPASAEAAPKPLESVAEQRTIARMKGYEGENCAECGNFTMVRNGTCLKCDTCGSTSGCS